MPQVLRTILAIVLGLFIGGAVNMAIVLAGPQLIAPPAGADVTTTEGLRASLHLFEARHFVAPFAAHAMGTLVGAVVAARLAGRHATLAAWAVGSIFLAGGVMSAWMLPAPAWFIALDLLLAYLPMAILGRRLARRA